MFEVIYYFICSCVFFRQKESYFYLLENYDLYDEIINGGLQWVIGYFGE